MPEADALVVGTHGRGFWILDDITPLRQVTPDTVASGARLFAPQQAWRFRWSKYTDTPLPPDEPAGENPPDGAIINYWLKADAASPVTLEILTEDGELVRRFSSADEPEAIDPTSVDAATIERTPAPAALTEPFLRAPVVLVVCVDLKVVASMDQDLARVGIISGASIYPFAWNILLAARHEGFAGTITTLAAAQEPRLQERLALPRHVAVCAVMPLGRPVRRLTKLKRKPVAEFAMRERWGGPPLTAPRRD